ncbi:MAG: hypothetical protein JXR51_10415 [Bacteroidales bacterium]|nr:hypothetical protein [Bacteroidales bacterium]MBN2757579.1 hypothetical protein [Bacteroidales bacterium]
MKSIKTICIHGLDSEAKPEKLEIMKNIGLDVYALHIDYRKNKNAYFDIKSLIIKQKAEFLIGSSFGGMLAYYLSEEFGIPCLLFNPAILYQSIDINIPEIKENHCPLRIVILGQKDNIINPHQNADFFKTKERNNLLQKIISCSWLEHSIDFQTFEEMILLAVNNYKKWKRLN